MSIDWDKTRYLEKESNIYSFSQNPLLKRNHNIHLYMPWSSERENELMFRVKECICKRGFANLPFMEKNGAAATIPLEVLTRLKAQLQEGRETHLVMSNLDSIHILRVTKILNRNETKKLYDYNLNFYGEKHSKYDLWIQVDDLFVLEANHDGNTDAITKKLEEYIETIQTQNVFKPMLKPIGEETAEHKIMIHGERWVDMNRSVTYDYFIRSCELRDNIFQDTWNYLSRKTQHELISCELARYNAIFYRDQEKWNYLRSSFEAYREAIFSELNSVYVFPFINAIATYESLQEAWEGLGNGLVNPRIKKMIAELLSGERKQIDSLEDFLYYTQNAKSLLFTLKQKFTRKIHKEEFLLVENFLIRQESLVESMNCSPLVQKLKLIIEMKDWMESTNKIIPTAPIVEVKDFNLKLSHILSMMVSANYQDNIFFKLIEEKAAKGLVQKTFEDQVKTLINTGLKRAA